MVMTMYAQYWKEYTDPDLFLALDGSAVNNKTELEELHGQERIVHTNDGQGTRSLIMAVHHCLARHGVTCQFFKFREFHEIMQSTVFAYPMSMHLISRTSPVTQEIDQFIHASKPTK